MQGQSDSPSTRARARGGRINRRPARTTTAPPRASRTAPRGRRKARGLQRCPRRPRRHPSNFSSRPADGGLIAFAHTYLVGASALVFEPYYPDHRRIVEERGGKTETLPLRGENLELDAAECASLPRAEGARRLPPRAIIVCTPSQPTGNVFTSEELGLVAEVCQEFDLWRVRRVYEHYVTGREPHTRPATLRGCGSAPDGQLVLEVVDISGWRLGYAYAPTAPSWSRRFTTRSTSSTSARPRAPARTRARAHGRTRYYAA